MADYTEYAAEWLLDDIDLDKMPEHEEEEEEQDGQEGCEG
jgi:hypothetical protein